MEILDGAEHNKTVVGNPKTTREQWLAGIVGFVLDRKLGISKQGGSKSSN
jgi:hypothetical protein